MLINKNHQKLYFEEATHHFDTGLLIIPQYYQLLEMQHIERLLNISKKNTLIVDYGAGVGRVSFYFLQQGYNIHAIDISTYALDSLMNTYKKFSTSSWGKLTVHDHLNDKRLYDAIIGADVLHHIPLRSSLQLFKTKLLEKGKIVFSEPNALHFPWYVHYKMNKIPFSIERGILQCTLLNFKKILLDQKYHQIKIEGHGIIPTKLLDKYHSYCKKNAFNWSNHPLFKPFAYRFIVHAQKN